MNVEKIRKFTLDFINFVGNLQNYEPIAVLSHDNTDLDGAASALGLYLLLSSYIPQGGKIDLILSHTNQFVKQTLQNINYFNQIVSTDTNKSYNVVIILDTPYIPPYFQNGFQSVILIDHHIESQNTRNGDSELSGTIPEHKFLLKLIDSSASSCSEIIGQIWKYIEDEKKKGGNWNPDLEPHISQLLLMGILMDSNGLRYSENSVVPILDFLIRKGADLPTARSMSIRETPLDVKIARVKGAIRSEEIFQIREWIILFTHVNSYESTVCNGLLGLGADIAFCLAKRKDMKFRLIARASEAIQHATEFHLGKFMEKIALKYDGNSGGHKGAAGMNGQNLPSDLKSVVISALKKELKN
ncbi:MAG: DHH family phosphoesterase [Candidatus Lokiarchaeota archaeon]|nr:DHH family phosphoesterase [Candidatus Lokiarchaeota archaeon]